MTLDRDSGNVGAQWLVNPERVAACQGDPGLVVIDTRNGEGFEQGHIPGAQRLGLNPLLHVPGAVIDAETFTAEMSRLGVGPRTRVVAYDDGNNLLGARLWWVLRHHGHHRAQVLDGGWDGWVMAGLPVSTAPAAAREEAAFVPAPHPELLAETSDVRAAMDDPDAQILDVRGDAEWYRDAPTEHSMAGHIPGALHVDWSDVIDPATRRFHTPERLGGMEPGENARRDCRRPTADRDLVNSKREG